MSQCERITGSRDFKSDLITNSFPNNSPIRVLGILIILAIAITGSIVPASAQQKSENPIIGYRILGESDAGPYRIQLQVSPAGPIVGTSRFAVRVRDAETGNDIDGAIVRVFGSPSEEGEAQQTFALNSPYDPTYYLSQLDLENEGVWGIEVFVESDLGEGTTIMSIQVNPRGRDGSFNGLGTVLFGLVILSFVLGILWLWYSSNKAIRRRDQKA